MVGQVGVVDAVMLQRQHKTGTVQVVLGDFILAVKFPKSLIQRMIHLVELVSTRNPQVFQVVFVVNALKSHFSSSVKVPQSTVEVEEDMLVF